MQDRYAGDIGDYVKLALLRCLGAGRLPAIAWYRTPSDTSNDGRHIDYLSDRCEAEWRKFDPDLYDGLRRLVQKNERSISGLEAILEPLPARFFGEPILGPSNRAVWFADMANWALRADPLFLDPDNGISAPGTTSEKHVSFEEIEYLRQRAGALIIYHHQTRAKGGHFEEIERIGKALVPRYEYKAVCAIRAGMWSPRVFFIIAPDIEMWSRAEAFVERWAPHLSFHAITEAPDALGLTPGASVWHRADAAEPFIHEQIARGEFDHPFQKRLNPDG